MCDGTQEKTINILYFITELNIGGAEKVLVHMLAHLDRSRFIPTVACLYGGDSPIADEIRALDIPVIDLGMTAKWRWDAFWRLYRLLCRERPTILHTSLFHANIPGRALGRLSGVPIIVTWRQNINIGGKLREFMNRWTAWLDDSVVAVCELARQAEIKHARVSPDKVIIIYNAINTTAFSATNPQAVAQIRHTFGISEDTLLVGAVGRLHPQKGLTDLLAAIAQVRVHVYPIRLLLIGDGELRSELEAQARLLGLSDIVTFAGIRMDVPEILAALDVFAFPSLWEGLPLAVLEAMAAGLPVVATRVGGIPEAVEDGVTGLLVPPRDPEALAEAIITLLQDRERAVAMGQAGRARVEGYFSVERMVQQTEALYEELIRGKMGLEWVKGKGWCEGTGR